MIGDKVRQMSVRFVIMIAIVFGLLGFAVVPAKDKVTELYEQYLYRQMLLTEPAYQARDLIEVNASDFTVLNIFAGERSVTAWVMFDGAAIQQLGEDEAQVYFVNEIRQVFLALGDVYPDVSSYSVVFAQSGKIPTIEGSKVYIKGLGAYTLTTRGLAMWREDSCPCMWGNLFEAGELQGQGFMWQLVTLPELLQREPGYKWPWE